MVAKSAGHGSLIGATLGGYKVEALIGRGAMGTVYLAQDVKLKRPVALKVLLGSLARTPSVVKQFHLEAQAAAPLRHPAIVRVYSAGMEEGTPYIAMEFVDGEPLDRFMRRKGPIKWQQAFHIAGHLALALEVAHRNGVVHRDVKPSNIMLERSGGVRLTDFGIASIHDDSETTFSTSFIGTPQYMSPEQCTGGEVGPASDIYALGVTLYQMISGELPFRGETSIALIKNICTETAPRLNKVILGVPDDVARLVAFLLEKDLRKRPSDGRIVNSLITRIQKQKGGVSAVPEALTAFIKEEAEPRPFSSVHKSARKRATSASSSSKSSRPEESRIAWGQVARIAAVALLALGTLAAWPLAGTLARDRQIEQAPVVSLATFGNLEQGIMLAQLYSDGFSLRRLSWVGNRPVLLVEAEGIRGTLTDGAIGLLVADPVERQILSLQPLSGPAMSPARSNVVTAGLSRITVPPSPKGSPLHDSVLLYARRADATTVALAQRWNEATPRPAMLYRVHPGTMRGGATQTRAPPHTVVKPDGYTVCLVLRDDVTGAHYLAERDVRDMPLDFVGPRRTFSGGDILPQSVQYSPNGSLIAFLRAGGNKSSELWIIPSGGDSRSGLSEHGRVLTTGVAGDEIAFSPDGQRIATRVWSGDGPEPEIAVIDLRQGRVETLFGSGTLSSEAWHRSGQYLIIVQEAQSRTLSRSGRATSNRPQLWAVEVEPPYSRIQLTKLKQGISGAYAVSRDGAWAAAATGHSTAPTLVFVDLAAMGVRRKA